MMTLHAISAGSGIDYLMRTVASGDQEIKAKDLNGYWSSGGDTPGTWIGREAFTLGLVGQVTQEAADAIFKDGAHPTTGKPLGLKWKTYATADERFAAMMRQEPDATEARQMELRKEADKLGQQTARAGWESVFSPVKSWSVLWGVSNDATRARMEEAEQAAFEKVWERIESDAAWTRVGPRGGLVQVEARGLMAAAFVHRSSRAGDPDFHRHVAISSKVRDEQGRWLALDARPLHRITVALSEMYTTELEREMFERMGIMAAPREDSIRPDKRPIREYLGVSTSMVSLFSQRRRQTEKALIGLIREFQEREGREPSRPEQYELAQMAALTGRPDKRPKSVGAERRQWRRRAWQAGISLPGKWVKAAQAATRKAVTERPEPAPLVDVVAAIVVTLESHRESWTRANAEAETYRQLTAAGWHLAAGESFDELVTRVIEHVLSPDNCELLSPPESLAVPSRYLRLDGSPIFVQVGSARYTSHNIKRWESELTEAANRPTSVTRLPAEQINAALAAGDAKRGFAPSEEQRAVVHGVFTGDVRIQPVIGRAGTGKTTIMKLIREVADAHGIELLGLAGGQIQADNLAEAAGIRAENIARWRTMSETYAPGQARWTLKPNTIVIVDEAGQASTPDLHALLTQVDSVGGRLLPVGDPRQLGSAGVGGALALLESDSRALYLSEVRRFRSAGGALRQWEIEAATALSRGDAEASWEAYSSRGRIHVGSLDEMIDAAYEAWQRDTADGLTSILIAPNNALATQLSDRARTDRVAAGTVDDTHTVTLADGNSAGTGDQIVTRVNNRKIRCEDTRQYVRNGDVWTVRGVLTGGGLLVEHSTTGGRAELPAEYVADGGVQLGYAITKDRAQGVDVHTGHGLLVPGMDANSVYPTLTRGGYTNHAYVSTDDQAVNLETGEPGRPLTGRQAWAAIVSRDGTQLSATSTGRRLWDEAEAIRTHVHRLRFVLEEIADADCVDAIAQLIGNILANQLSNAPAWPALRSQLAGLADQGYDTDRLVTDAAAARDWENVNDYAAILHSRIKEIVGDAYALADEADRPTTAPTYNADPIAVGDDVLAAIGLRLPPVPVDRQAPDAHRDEPIAFTHTLAEAIRARAEHLADAAQEDARTGQGWAAGYGGEPQNIAEAVAWRDRIAAAAAYRDLANYTGADATGPAPTEAQAELRGLWRAAQKGPDAVDAYADALALAASGTLWLDAIGTPPPPGGPTRPAWTHAVTAVASYRRLWGFGHETVAVGAPPSDPVQRVDYDSAINALTAYGWVSEHPSLVDADPNTLAVLIARGQAGEATAERAVAAIASYDAATRAQNQAEQAAEDATNRADAAHQQATNQPEPDHIQAAHTLQGDAQRAQDAAQQARARVDAARAEVEAAAPGALTAREDMRRAEEARRVVAHRRLNPTDPGTDPGMPPASPEPEHQPWGNRPHGTLTDAELITTAQQAVTTAVEVEKGPEPQAAEAAAELREHAAELWAESSIRALMDEEQRTVEVRERTAHRARSPRARLDRAYADQTGPDAMHAERGRCQSTEVSPPQPSDRQAARHAEPQSQPTPPAPKPTRPPEAPAKPVHNRTEARLEAAYADHTGPEAMQADQHQTRPQPPARPTTEAKLAAAKPEQKPPVKKPRGNVAKRLDEAYNRDHGPQNPRPDRRRPPPPRRPDGPSI